jgi:hypothetical protein
LCRFRAYKYRSVQCVALLESPCFRFLFVQSCKGRSLFPFRFATHSTCIQTLQFYLVTVAAAARVGCEHTYNWYRHPAYNAASRTSAGSSQSQPMLPHQLQTVCLLITRTIGSISKWPWSKVIPHLLLHKIDFRKPSLVAKTLVWHHNEQSGHVQTYILYFFARCIFVRQFVHCTGEAKVLGQRAVQAHLGGALQSHRLL